MKRICHYCFETKCLCSILPARAESCSTRASLVFDRNGNFIPIETIIANAEANAIRQHNAAYRIKEEA